MSSYWTCRTAPPPPPLCSPATPTRPVRIVRAGPPELRRIAHMVHMARPARQNSAPRCAWCVPHRAPGAHHARRTTHDVHIVHIGVPGRHRAIKIVC